MAKHHRGKTVTKPVGLKLLEWPLSEKQIPQVVENLESVRSAGPETLFAVIDELLILSYARPASEGCRSRLRHEIAQQGFKIPGIYPVLHLHMAS